MDRYDHSVTTLVNSFSTGQPCAMLVCHHKCGFNETPITNTSLVFLSLKTTAKNSSNTSSTASKTLASHWDNVRQLLLISFFGRMQQLAQESVSQPVSQTDALQGTSWCAMLRTLETWYCAEVCMQFGLDERNRSHTSKCTASSQSCEMMT